LLSSTLGSVFLATFSDLQSVWNSNVANEVSVNENLVAKNGRSEVIIKSSGKEQVPDSQWRLKESEGSESMAFSTQTFISPCHVYEIHEIEISWLYYSVNIFPGHTHDHRDDVLQNIFQWSRNPLPSQSKCHALSEKQNFSESIQFDDLTMKITLIFPSQDLKSLPESRFAMRIEGRVWQYRSETISTLREIK
jgi:hypothetical protein